MFTGIITDIGTITAVERKEKTLYVTIRTTYDTSTITPGASIACNGVCLTVTDTEPEHFSVDVSEETLSCTTANLWQEGMTMNLERALCTGDELGGHMVSGHVDGLGKLVKIESNDFCFTAPDVIIPYIVSKGSITINGVSLTINHVDSSGFTVHIIPHTKEHTTFATIQVGDKVNLEVDMLARYAERLLKLKS